MKRGKVTAEKKAEVLARITATTDYATLKGTDLVVEAVFEDPKVKADVTAKVEAATDAIYATKHLDPADHRPRRRLQTARGGSSASTSSRPSTR